MFSLLKKLNENLDSMGFRKLIIVLLNVFVVFLVIGLIAGYIRESTLKQAEPPKLDQSTDFNQNSRNSYEGRVTFIDPLLYKEDNVKFALYDTSDREIILLKAADQKLDLLEGMFVELTGNTVKTKDGQNNILIVSEVTMNASN